MSMRALLHGRMVGLGIVLLIIAFQGSPSEQQGADPSHMEGGKGTTSKVVKFQLRPDPLAR